MTNSGMCSIPTARPCDPTITAKHAVKYPVPASKGVNLQQGQLANNTTKSVLT